MKLTIVDKPVKVNDSFLYEDIPVGSGFIFNHEHYIKWNKNFALKVIKLKPSEHSLYDKEINLSGCTNDIFFSMEKRIPASDVYDVELIVKFTPRDK